MFRCALQVLLLALTVALLLRPSAVQASEALPPPLALHQRLYSRVLSFFSETLGYDTGVLFPQSDASGFFRPLASSTSTSTLEHAPTVLKSTSSVHQRLLELASRSMTPRHAPRSFYSYESPRLDPGVNFLELDPNTFLRTDTLTPDSQRSAQYSVNFIPAREFVMVYVNVPREKAIVTVSLPGQPPPVWMVSSDIDYSYLTPALQATVPRGQTYSLVPSEWKAYCSANNPTSNGDVRCQIQVQIELASGVSSKVDFRMSILKNLMLPFNALARPSILPGKVQTLGMEIGPADLPVLFQMQPEGAAFEAMSYIFNAANPVQWCFPTAGTQHNAGDEVDFLIGDDYAAGQFVSDASRQVDSQDAPPNGKYGNRFADPNYGANLFAPSFYLLAIYVPPDAGLANQANVVQVYTARNYKAPDNIAWSSSTYGIVGALTLLVLCLISCAIAFLRRRCRNGAGRSLDEFGGPAILTRAQRDELPQFDAQGRPIRYDAHGRVIPDLGARKEEIDALPRRFFRMGVMPTEDAHCTICLGDYEIDEAIKDLPCGHHFHSECISKWLQSKRLCPNCNQDITNATRRMVEQPAAAGEAAALSPKSGVAAADALAGLAAVKVAGESESDAEHAPLTIVESPGTPVGGLPSQQGAWCLPDAGGVASADREPREQKSPISSRSIVSRSTSRARSTVAPSTIAFHNGGPADEFHTIELTDYSQQPPPTSVVLPAAAVAAASSSSATGSSGLTLVPSSAVAQSRPSTPQQRPISRSSNRSADVPTVIVHVRPAPADSPAP